MKIVREHTGAGRMTLHDFEPTPDRICEDVARGLARSEKRLPSKYLYDDRGARLFERIMELDVYYPTRTEIGILKRSAAQIAERLGPAATLVEFGSGSGEKTWIVLEHLVSPRAYVPVDISRAQLVEFARRVAEAFPALDVEPVCADYTRDFVLPSANGTSDRCVAFFPGSTIGNFEPDDARTFLSRTRRLLGSRGRFLLGLDLRKDPGVIEAAYNDPQGVTRQFNLNLLARINRECGTDFDLAAFRHHAWFDADHGRVEMRLVSELAQAVHVPPLNEGDPLEISFERGDFITTEYSYKYDLDDFAGLAGEAGWHLDEVWTDERRWFAVVLLH